MDIQTLKQEARSAVTPRVRALAGWFMAGQAALILVVNGINHILEGQIAGTGGLAGLGTRQVLEMIRMLVMLAGTAVLPFWGLGYLKVAMAAVRGQQTDRQMLFAGFQRFFPALRLMILRTAMFFALGMLAMQAGTLLYMLSPASMAVMETVESLLAQGEAALTPEAMEGLMGQIWPMYLLIAVAVGVAVIPAFYRLRLAEYSILDGNDRALVAMAESKRRTWNKKFWLFRLDLGFWWYYLAMGLASTVAYLDLFLPKWGVAVDPDGAYWVCLIVSLAAQVAVGYFAMPQVQAAYALSYDRLAPAERQ